MTTKQQYRTAWIKYQALNILLFLSLILVPGAVYYFLILQSQTFWVSALWVVTLAVMALLIQKFKVLEHLKQSKETIRRYKSQQIYR